MVDTEYLVDDSRQSAIVRVSSTDHRCFVDLISVEFSEYNIELVDFRYFNSTQLSDDRLDRSTRSISGSTQYSTAILHDIYS